MLYDPDVFDKELKGLCIPMQIKDADAWITRISFEFFNQLNAVGYGKFRTTVSVFSPLPDINNELSDVKD